MVACKGLGSLARCYATIQMNRNTFAPAVPMTTTVNVAARNGVSAAVAMWHAADACAWAAKHAKSSKRTTRRAFRQST